MICHAEPSSSPSEAPSESPSCAPSVSPTTGMHMIGANMNLMHASIRADVVLMFAFDVECVYDEYVINPCNVYVM